MCLTLIIVMGGSVATHKLWVRVYVNRGSRIWGITVLTITLFLCNIKKYIQLSFRKIQTFLVGPIHFINVKEYINDAKVNTVDNYFS